MDVEQRLSQFTFPPRGQLEGRPSLVEDPKKHTDLTDLPFRFMLTFSALSSPFPIVCLYGAL